MTGAVATDLSLPSPRGVADRLFVLQLGAERVDKTLSVPGAAPGHYWEPFLAVLVLVAHHSLPCFEPKLIFEAAHLGKRGATC